MQPHSPHKPHDTHHHTSNLDQAFGPGPGPAWGGGGAGGCGDMTDCGVAEKGRGEAAEKEEQESNQDSCTQYTLPEQL